MNFTSMLKSIGTSLFFCLAFSYEIPSGKAVGFTDVTVAAGVNYSHVSQPIPPTTINEPLHMLGGAAAGDFDGDGWVDLFVTRLDDTDILYKNQGDGTFQDVSLTAGFDHSLRTNGASWGDIDNDGDLDLYVTTVFDSSKRHHLYVNQGDGSFSEEAISRSADVSSTGQLKGFSSTFGDYDRDGYLDIFVTEWRAAGNGHSRLLRNLGASSPGHFEDKTVAAGIDLNENNGTTESFGFTPQFTDLDRDGHMDLVVASDFGTSKLYWNNGDETFTNGTAAAGVGSDENGMGSTVADYDGDGDLDWFVSSIYDPGGCPKTSCGWSHSGNRLYRNEGNRTFSDVTDEAGVRDGGWGWGSAFLDYDNDGDLDLTHTNGIDFGATTDDEPFLDDPTKFWVNDSGVFTEAATQLGITNDESGKGLLTLDFDNDGDLDLFIVNNSSSPVLYRNDTISPAGDNGYAWLKIKTVGGLSNRDGIGAQITVDPDTSILGDEVYREVSAGSNFLSQSEMTVHVGLGNITEDIDLISIIWPSGYEQQLRGVSPNQFLLVTEIPEPSSIILASLGLALFYTRRFKCGIRFWPS